MPDISNFVPSSILSFIGVLFSFVLLFIVVPFIVMGFKFDIDTLLHNCFVSLMFGSIIIVNLVYILSWLDIMSFWPLLLSIFMIILLVRFTIYRTQTLQKGERAIEFIYLSIKGMNKRKVIFRDVRRSFSSRIKVILLQLSPRAFPIIALIGGIVIMSCIRFYFNFTTMFFSYSDVYVHTSWTNRLIGGELFYDGAYPFGMHNMAAAQSVLFGINTVTLMRFYGCVACVFVVLSLYLLLSRMFKSRAAVIFAILIYTITNIIPSGAHTRFSAALPQEVAMIYLIPCALYLIDYLNTQKKLPFMCLCIAFSMTIIIHFYVTIFAALLIIGVFIAYIPKLFKGKNFIKLMGCAIVALIIAAAPMLLATTVGGKPWHGTMDWAIGIITGGDSNTVAKTPEEIKAEEQARALEEQKKAEELEKFKAMDLAEKLNYIVEFIAADGFYPVNYLRIALICMIPLLLFPIILLIIRKQQDYARMLLSIAIYSWILIIMGALPKLGFPDIVQRNRIIGFFALNVGLIYAFAIDVVLLPMQLLSRFKILSKISNHVANIAAIAGIAFLISKIGFQQIGYTFQFQYDAAITAYYNIVENFEPLKWTLVSPVEETCMILNHGWHYELSEMMYELAEYKEDNTMTRHFHGNDVFFFIEKRPLRPNRMTWPGKMEHEPELPVSKSDAAKDILEIRENLGLLSAIYTEYESRRILMSKAYYWMEEYKKYHPKEISVYYEDDDLVVYRMHQSDPYSLNNVCIDYGYN